MNEHPRYKELLTVPELKQELKQVEQKLLKQKQNAFKRFPVLFAILVIFGTAITFSGVGRIIAKIPELYNNPIITLLVGLLILLFTGALYKYL